MSETIPLPLVVILIVSEVFERVNVPFPEYVMLICVWFIGVWLVVLIRSCWIGFGDNSIADDEESVVILGDDDEFVVAVVLLLVVAATGIIVILKAITNVAKVNKVAFIDMTLFSFLL